MENGPGHHYRSHYRLIVDDDRVRAVLGESRHVALAENALCAEMDGCVSCFEAVVDEIAVEPTALLTTRRFGSLILGPVDITPIGSPEEAEELQMVIAHLAQARDLAAELLRFCAMNMIAAHHAHDAHPHSHDHGHGGGSKVKKRKVVRHPTRRVRTKEERRRDS
jgi:hypothetical protein